MINLTVAGNVTASGARANASYRLCHVNTRKWSTVRDTINGQYHISTEDQDWLGTKIKLGDTILIEVIGSDLYGATDFIVETDVYALNCELHPEPDINMVADLFSSTYGSKFDTTYSAAVNDIVRVSYAVSQESKWLTDGQPWYITDAKFTESLFSNIGVSTVVIDWGDTTGDTQVMLTQGTYSVDVTLITLNGVTLSRTLVLVVVAESLSNRPFAQITALSLVTSQINATSNTHQRLFANSKVHPRTFLITPTMQY